MATYKLIQDIEAEDHILGPLTLRQFIFALVAVFCFYLCFIIITKQVYFLLAFFLPPGLFCAFFAVPFGRDQPTEIWALAKLRFLLKPRRRIWNQSGVKELVTITAPKKVERVLTKGFSQTEVQSRLKALANTLDSRGWAIKNVVVNSYHQPDPVVMAASDRLIDIASIPQEVPSFDVLASDDMLDETSNPIAQQFDSMINESSQVHHEQLLDEFNSTKTSQTAKEPEAAPDQWFMSKVRPAGPMGQPEVTGTLPTPVATPDMPNEAVLTARLKAQSSSQQASYAHLRTLQPLGSQPPASTVPLQPVTDNETPNPVTAVTATPDPAILTLANNDDLNVATLAREAQKAKSGDQPPQDEIVVSLH